MSVYCTKVVSNNFYVSAKAEMFYSDHGCSDGQATDVLWILSILNEVTNTVGLVGEIEFCHASLIGTFDYFTHFMRYLNLGISQGLWNCKIKCPQNG